ncbi:MAG: Trk system potassium transporter TrkA [Lachnospiraceae bacterium]|jgi:trk system potassium uptake protein TrkA|nr:Trk system potassium transporter TrkA [Lachnospiraceae bacterium]
MQIIVVGCGNVGSTLTEQLSKEGHNITVIDSKTDRLKRVTDSSDVMGVLGNGATYSVQMEAGIEEADLLIAVTDSDELNLLCCLIAKKAGNCHTIARVRNPVYSLEVDFIKEELGLSMVINPEAAAATAIARLLKFPSAIEVETFARGRVELSKFRLEAGNILTGLSLKDISSRLHCDVLVCTVERGEEVMIPDGNFVLREKDMISVVASSRNIVQFFKKMGMATGRVKDAMIVGGGSTAYYLSKQLLAMGIHIKIVERDRERCEELCELLPQAAVVHGDGTDRSVLLEEGIEKAQAFVSLTNVDEENIMLSLFAKSVSRAKLVTRVHRISYDEMIGSLDIGSIVYPRYTTAENIVRYVCAMSNTVGSNVETLYKLIGDKAEALEFWIREKSPAVGIPLQKMNLKPNILLACINRRNSVIIPGGQDMIQVGDTVVVVTTNTGLHDIRDILR